MILIDCVAVVRPEARLARYVPHVSAHSMIWTSPFLFRMYGFIRTSPLVPLQR